MIAVMNTNGSLGHGVGSPISGGVFTIVSPPSVTVRAAGESVYRGPLQYIFAGGDASGFDSGTVATTTPQVVNPTAVKTKADILEVIRQDDAGVMAAVGTVSGTLTPISGAVEVVDAGQDEVKAQ